MSSMPLRHAITPSRGREASVPGAVTRLGPAGEADEFLFRSGDPDFMLSLARGLCVLEAFSSGGRSPTLAGLSGVTGLNRAAVRRCLYTLRELGYVEADGRTYRLTSKVLTVGRSSEPANSMCLAAQSALEDLRGKLGGSCSVGMLDQGMVLYLARAATSRTDGLRLAAGSRTPAYCTALGRVLLSSLTDQRATAELSKVAILPLTPFTVTSLRRLWEILVQVRADDYALNDQELKTGLRAIAVPVRNRVGAVVAAMCVSTGASLTPRVDMTREYLPILKTAAVRLGRQLPPAKSRGC